MAQAGLEKKKLDAEARAQALQTELNNVLQKTGKAEVRASALESKADLPPPSSKKEKNHHRPGLHKNNFQFMERV